jgi:Flp pilus assembly protein TadG
MKRQPIGHRRSGAAVVEFAVCLPVILLIVFGSIEAASMLFLRQALVQSAYEGVKVAARNNGDNATAIQAVKNVAAGRRLKNMSVTFSPKDVESAAQGEMIRVTVSAPGNANSFIPFGPFKDRTVAAQAVMVKE